MEWIDIACIVFACVTANHLGLIKAIEKLTERELVIINCPKCLTFWVTLIYCFGKTEAHTVAVLAMPFMSSYMAIWLELFEGYIDTLYMKLYEKIYADPTGGASSSDPDEGCSASDVSEL